MVNHRVTFLPSNEDTEMNGIQSLANENVSTSKQINPNIKTAPIKDNNENTESNSPATASNSGLSISNEASILNAASEAIQELKGDKDIPYYLQPPPEGFVPDATALSGNGFHFLTKGDREALQEAYDYAIDNGQSAEDVELAAFFLSHKRYVEDMVLRGVKYSVHVPSGKNMTYEPGSGFQDAEGSPSNNLDTARDNLLKEIVSRGLFSNNPMLNKDLFLGPLYDFFYLDQKDAVSIIEAMVQTKT